MGLELGARARAGGASLRFFDEIDSTNEEAKRRALSGERGPAWFVAARQTKGRGRLGREWTSLSGNLHASLLVDDFGPPRLAPQLGFVAGVATISALIATTGEPHRFALKWPNDVLLDGAKLAGILLEGVSRAAPAESRSDFACVIGVGVNCATAPDGLSGPVAALARLARPPSLGALFARLTDEMDEKLRLWAGGAGFPSVRELWLAHAAGLEGRVRVDLGQERVEGRFETIDAGGRLIISTATGQRTIEAGDIFLPDIQAAPAGREQGS